MLPALALTLLLATRPPQPYHIELEANTAAPFPYLSRFGTIRLHIYPAGVRADSVWLNGFSRLGTPTTSSWKPIPLRHFPISAGSARSGCTSTPRGCAPTVSG